MTWLSRLFTPALVVLSASPVGAQCSDGTPPPCSRPPTQTAPAHSLLVLYLENLSRDSSDAAIADGLTEELIARLSQAPGLHVASRYASQSYRRRRVSDLRAIGLEAGVRYVMDGTLRRTGEDLRITLAITNTTNGFNVWGQTFEHPVAAIFSVEDSVAIDVAQAVLGRLSAGVRAHLAPPPPSVSTEAYQAYLRAQSAIRGRTSQAATEAVDQYRRAIMLDPRFARAWAGLARVLSLARDWGWNIQDVPPDSVQPLAARAAREALVLDSTTADSWVAAAMAMRPENLSRALEFHRRAVALDSESTEALHQLAWGYLATGGLDSAVVYERRAIARDPYYAFAYSGLGRMLDESGHPGEALAIVAQGLSVDSTNAPLYWQAAAVELCLGRLEAARIAVDRAAALGFDSLGIRIMRAQVQLRSGDTATVRHELPELEQAGVVNSQRGGLAFAAAAQMSGLYAQLGESGNSVRWAGRVVDWPRRYYAFVYGHHCFWEPVRSDPRFQALLESLNR